MRKAIIITCLVLSGLIILDSFHAVDALAMLFLAGIIPGTNIVLSGQTMMSFFALLIGFVLARLANRAFLNLLPRLTPRLRA
jgi:hypothetical protein